MATADQVKALIRSHADGDDTRFYAIAMQVAAQAARSGHSVFAQELRDLVDQVKARAKAVEPVRGSKPVPLVQPPLRRWTFRSCGRAIAHHDIIDFFSLGASQAL